MLNNLQDNGKAAVCSIALCLAFLFSCRNGGSGEDTEAADTVAAGLQIPDSIYGFPVDSFTVHEGRVKRNESLSAILARYNVDHVLITNLAQQSRPIFDVRRLAEGGKYTVLCANDPSGQARCFIYERSAADYIVYDWRDSLTVYSGRKKVDTLRRAASGVIRSSLYANMVNNEVNPNLAIALSEIYAWSIDFYRIQKEDRYKVIYDEYYVDGKSIGPGRIHSAWFRHAGEDFYAVYFERDNTGDYYDENAKSLRRAFLKAPLKYSRISSGYSLRRFHPVLKTYRGHFGTDYAAPYGTPIQAVGNGTVSEAAYKGGNGRYVKIRHNGTYSTQYLHMSKIAAGVRPGVFVRQGQVIGYVGSTGLATGPHVCFRFWKNGRQVDHLREKIPPSEPVKEQHLTDYIRLKEQMKLELDNIPYQEDSQTAQAR